MSGEQFTKAPDEREPFTFDFSGRLGAGETITEITVTITVTSGTDPNPNAMIYGLPYSNGSLAIQGIQGGISGNTYHLNCHITTSAGWEYDSCCDLAIQAC